MRRGTGMSYGSQGASLGRISGVGGTGGRISGNLGLPTADKVDMTKQTSTYSMEKITSPQPEGTLSELSSFIPSFNKKSAKNLNLGKSQLGMSKNGIDDPFLAYTKQGLMHKKGDKGHDTHFCGDKKCMQDGHSILMKCSFSQERKTRNSKCSFVWH
jgi:hypothetical protein